uniref:Uncharacterized protein n=1 Tax=Arundo donax TaxID=35708 RepID=A0A0A8ZDM3_ARUDO
MLLTSLGGLLVNQETRKK